MKIMKIMHIEGTLRLKDELIFVYLFDYEQETE